MGRLAGGGPASGVHDGATVPGCLMSHNGPAVDYHEGIHRYIPVRPALRDSGAGQLADLGVQWGQMSDQLALPRHAAATAVGVLADGIVRRASGRRTGDLPASARHRWVADL